MNSRFRFRATFPVSYYDENGNDKDIKLMIYDVAVYSGGEIGFSAQQIETIINALDLPEVEEDTMWQFINDNYATSSYEWFVCDNAIVEQCTGLSDKNGNLIYEGDVVRVEYTTPQGMKIIKDCEVIFDRCAFWLNYNSLSEYLYNEFCVYEIIGNLHKQSEQKD